MLTPQNYCSHQLQVRISAFASTHRCVFCARIYVHSEKEALVELALCYVALLVVKHYIK